MGKFLNLAFLEIGMGIRDGNFRFSNLGFGFGLNISGFRIVKVIEIFTDFQGFKIVRYATNFIIIYLFLLI